ncbi:hypothetical protein DESAMIL20_1674 [Desulfurella amilsii]|uniref:Uncharacterized protein n=1 Tax=Desulfurella amilsii TaxID=1562698 RepID=A0A1X4XX57_9BACT|nr:hypothetical protein DESAMIL20_1674 [Desulfurella amilsii]
MRVKPFFIYLQNQKIKNLSKVFVKNSQKMQGFAQSLA